MEGAIETESLADELSQHMEFLRRMARALVRDEQVAEDVVQETMLAALSRPQEPSDIRAWLRSVLRRRVLMHFRSERRRIARETILMRDAGADADVASDRIAVVDVSLARRADVRMEVHGASTDAPAHFTNVQGPRGDNGLPVWSEFVPVRNDIVSAINLPEGAAVARVLSGDAEIGRVAFELVAGRGTQTVVIPVASGELQVRHGAVEVDLPPRRPRGRRRSEVSRQRQPISGRDQECPRGRTVAASRAHPRPSQTSQAQPSPAKPSHHERLHRSTAAR